VLSDVIGEEGGVGETMWKGGGCRWAAKVSNCE